MSKPSEGLNLVEIESSLREITKKYHPTFKAKKGFFRVMALELFQYHNPGEDIDFVKWIEEGLIYETEI